MQGHPQRSRGAAGARFRGAAVEGRQAGDRLSGQRLGQGRQDVLGGRVGAQSQPDGESVPGRAGRSRAGLWWCHRAGAATSPGRWARAAVTNRLTAAGFPAGWVCR